MPKLLAKSTLQSLDAKTLGELLQGVKEETFDDTLNQSHYHVAGSYQDKIAKVGGAFYKWLRQRRNDSNDEWYDWGYILSIMEDSIVFYVYGSYDCNIYYRVPYTVGEDTVTFGACEEVKVSLVVSELSSKVEASEEGTSSTVAMEQAATTPTNPIEGMESIEQAVERTFGDKKEEFSLASRFHAKILEQSVKKENDVNLIQIKGTATVFDIVNLNQVVFPRSCWVANMERMNQSAKQGRFTGKLEHPDSNTGLKDIAITFQSFTLDEKDGTIAFEGTVLPTIPDGYNLQVMLQAGVGVDISSRGYGTTKEEMYQGKKVKIVQDDFICTGFDAVEIGAAPGSGITAVSQTAVNLTETLPKINQTKEIGMTEDESNIKNGVGNEGKAPDTTPVAQSVATPPATSATPVAPVTQTVDPNLQWAANQSAQLLFSNAKANLLQNARKQLSDTGYAAFEKSVTGVAEGDIAGLKNKEEVLLPVMQGSFPAIDRSAEELTQNKKTEWGGNWVKQTAAELAPKTGAEYIERLLETVDDYVICKPSYMGQGLTDQHSVQAVTTLRGVMRKVLYNIAQSTQFGFNGPQALRMAMLQEARRFDESEKLAQSVLHQTLTDANTAVIAGTNGDPGGAPITNYLIFPLVTRVFPKLIMLELANIQPMDRPDGKIFYLSTYRQDDPTSGQRKRIDLNTSANPFNSSFATSSSELSAIKRLKFELHSESVRANSKKLAGSFSEEEAQDLRAYHGLEAAQLLLDGMAREIANERNVEFLNMLLAGAAAGNLTYGTTVPGSGGYTQNTWDEYLWVYLQKLSNNVMSYRQGGLTHLVVGMDAALNLTKPMRGGFSFTEGNGSAGFDMEKFPGATFYGTLKTPSGNMRIFATNFWAQGTTNGKKILGLRRGAEFGDTPAIFAPYTLYTSPALMDPNDMGWTQGTMERSAMKMVVPEAAAVLTVDNSTGVPL